MIGIIDGDDVVFLWFSLHLYVYLNEGHDSK